ncbi:MAG TPA: MFS transporter [Candidatus Obscuribacterales bacterium]
MELSQDQLKTLLRWRTSTFLVMLFGYIGYYMIRQNLSAAFPLMEKAFHYTNSELGLIAASSEIVYAIGKFVNGPLADRLGGKKIFLLGMAGGIVCNLAFAFGSSILWFVVVWCICRYFLSMGWGGVAKTIGAWYEPEKNGTVMGWISLSFQFGGVLATLFAGWLVSQGQSWDKLFIYPALIVTAVLVWSFFASKEEPGDVVPGASFHGEGHETSLANFESESQVGAGQIINTLFAMSIFRHLLVFAFLTTFLRSIFIFWTPKFLVDIGMGNASAIFGSALLPFLGCIGTILLGWYTDTRARHNRARAMWIMLVGLTLSLVGIALLAPSHKVQSASVSQPAPTAATARPSSAVPYNPAAPVPDQSQPTPAPQDPTASQEHSTPATHLAIVVLLGLSGFFLLGPYSMSAGALTLDIAGARGAGTCAGIIDGMGYIGGALATWGAGKLSDSLGWSQVFWVLAACALFSVGSAMLMSRHFNRVAQRLEAAVGATGPLGKTGPLHHPPDKS